MDNTSIENLNSSLDYACKGMTADEESSGVYVSYVIFTYLSLTFVIIGCLGNTVSAVVFSQQNIRKLSSNVYLLILSVSDTCYLLSAFLSYVLAALRCIHFPDSSLDIVNRSAHVCKLLQYFMDLFSDYSTLLILAFTVERYFACYHAVWFRNNCTVQKARRLCLVTMVMISIVIAPHHFLYLQLHTEHNYCSVAIDYEKHFTIVYFLEVAAFKIIPVIVITILNLFIIRKVRQLNLENALKTKSPQWHKEDKHIQLTVLLLLVSSTYVLLYFPVLIHFLVWSAQVNQVIYVSKNVITISKNYTRLLYIMGFAINFFLYTLSGKIFRDQLLLVFNCCKYMRYIKVDKSATYESSTSAMITLK